MRNLAAWKRIALVCISSTTMGIDVVRGNMFRGMLKVLRALDALGYRRIGIALRSHPQHLPDDDARFGAALAFQSDL